VFADKARRLRRRIGEVVAKWLNELQLFPAQASRANAVRIMQGERVSAQPTFAPTADAAEAKPEAQFFHFFFLGQYRPFVIGLVGNDFTA